MNMEKLTNKTREALSGARQIALERRNTELKNIHVLAALLKDENGLAGSILSRMVFTKRKKLFLNVFIGIHKFI